MNKNSTDWAAIMFGGFIVAIICFLAYSHFVLEPKIDALIADDEPAVELEVK